MPWNNQTGGGGPWKPGPKGPWGQGPLGGGNGGGGGGNPTVYDCNNSADDDGDGLLMGDDSLPLDKALAELKAAYLKQTKALAKKVRASTGLTQKDASLLLTGSPNSFSKYELIV